MVKLRQLLLSSELRRYIDLHSDGRVVTDRHNRITWDKLFNQVVTLVRREVEHCMKPVKPVANRRSATSQQGSSKGNKISKVLLPVLIVSFSVSSYGIVQLKKFVIFIN